MFDLLFSERGLSLDRLKVLIEVRDAGSIAQAAPGDPVRQSQYSRQLRELSEFFGCEVAQRRGKILKLTEQGERLAELAREQLRSLDDFRAECKQTSVAFTIGAGDSLIQWLVIPRLGKIIDEFPGTHFATTNLRTNEIVQQLTDCRLDFGIIRKNAMAPGLKSEVEEIRGNADALGAPEWAEHVLNVRFRAENVDLSRADSFFDRDDPWILARHRYMLYDFIPEERSRLEGFFIRRRGTTDDPSVRSIFRRGTKPVEITPEHAMMQKTLLAQLRKEYPTATIVREESNVDVTVTSSTERILFEIKSDLEPREVIRQALGQLLEYAYHPLRRSESASRLVVVGRSPLRPLDQQYLDLLRSRFSLPLEYRVVSV